MENKKLTASDVARMFNIPESMLVQVEQMKGLFTASQIAEETFRLFSQTIRFLIRDKRRRLNRKQPKRTRLFKRIKK